MWKGLLLACGLFAFLMIFGWVVVDNVAYQLESQDDLEQETIDTINRITENYIDTNIGFVVVFLFFGASLIILIIVGKYTDSENNYLDSIDKDKPIEENCVELRWSKIRKE